MVELGIGGISSSSFRREFWQCVQNEVCSCDLLVDFGDCYLYHHPNASATHPTPRSLLPILEINESAQWI
jgi:hypothetical protein